jgi:hypothetical protein
MATSCKASSVVQDGSEKRYCRQNAAQNNNLRGIVIPGSKEEMPVL